MTEGDRRPCRLAILNSHPIQYFAPLYRRLSSEGDIDLTVYFCSRAGAEVYKDKGFGGEEVAWDVPLLEGYDHVFLSNVRGDRPPAGFWSLVNPGIVGELKRERFDVVWIHGHAHATCLLAVAGALVSGSALFMRCETHLDLERSSVRLALRRLLMPLFYRRFQGLLAIGSRNAEFYRSIGVPDERIFRVPYVVENQRFRAGAQQSEQDRTRRRGELGLPHDGVPVILFVSKLTSRKRPLDLLRAFRRLRENRRERAALAIVGAGPELERLRRFVTRHDVPRVHFLGFLNQSELPAVYGACDIFVLPSVNEPWGLVVNEAMCAGLPVVVSRETGSAADLVEDGRNGFRFPPGDVAALTEYLARLVTDEDLRKRMGRRSSELIENWDLDACVAGVREALDRTTPRFDSGNDTEDDPRGDQPRA